MGNLNLNLSNVETRTTGDFSPLPNGVYNVVATDAEVKSNKAGTGQFIAFTFEVTDGPYVNRKVWHNMTIQHDTSTMAVEIGQKQLKEYATAIGHPDPNHIAGTNELINKPVKAKIGVQKNDETRNEIKFFNPIRSGAAGGATTAPATAGASSGPSSRSRAINPFAD